MRLVTSTSDRETPVFTGFLVAKSQNFHRAQVHPGLLNEQFMLPRTPACGTLLFLPWTKIDVICCAFLRGRAMVAKPQGQ